MEKEENNYKIILVVCVLIITVCIIKKDDISIFFKENKQNFNFFKSDPILVKKKIHYSNGLIIAKLYNIRSATPLLIYQNSEKNVFQIRDPELWKLVKVYDSVKVGYVQDTTSLFKEVQFISIKVLGVAKDSVKDFKIINEYNNEYNNRNQTDYLLINKFNYDLIKKVK